MDMPVTESIELNETGRTPRSALARPLWSAVGLIAILWVLSLGQDIYTYGWAHGVLPDTKLMFDVDYEKSFFTWISESLLFSAAVLLVWLSHEEVRVGGRLHVYWRILATVFVLLSADEHVGLHERASEWLSIHYPTHGLFYYGWVMLAVPACVAGAAISLRMLKVLERPLISRLMLSAVVFVVGALGVEMLGGAYAEVHGQVNLTYHLLANIEEGLEGAGILLFLFGLDRYRRRLAAIS